MLKGLYILNKDLFSDIYGEKEREDIEKVVDIYAPVQSSEDIRGNLDLLKDVEVIFSGWGAPILDKKFLNSAPKLKAIFYGAGTIKYFTTEEFWERNITITSAYAANAVPVAEYTLSQILFCLKGGWKANCMTKNKIYKREDNNIIGAYGSTVGIISLGMIGSKVCELLKNFDVNVIAYSYHSNEERAKRLGVTMVSLEDIFKKSDVVSLHTPWLKQTENMIKAQYFESMKTNASFINTARGAVVNEKEMIEVLKKRKDIQAVLDVTYPEPPEEKSPLFTMPNVALTPHIAGSIGKECNRMGRYMVDELYRFINGEKLNWEVTKDKADKLA